MRTITTIRHTYYYYLPIQTQEVNNYAHIFSKIPPANNSKSENFSITQTRPDVPKTTGRV